jgi:signal transduction histidine kinase
MAKMAKTFVAQLPQAAEPALTHRKVPRLMQPSVDPAVDPAVVGQQIIQISINSPEDAVLHKIALALAEVFQADGTVVEMVDGKQSISQTLAWHPNAQHPSVEEPLSLWSCPELNTLLQSGEPWACSDLAKSEVQVHSTLASRCQATNIRAILALTTRSQGKINGSIAIFRQQPYEWTEREMQMLRVVCEPVALTLDRVLQSRTIRSLQRRTHAFNHQQSLIAQLTKVIHNSLDLTQILQEAIEGITQTLQVSHGLVMLLTYKDKLHIFKKRSRPPEARVTVVGQSLGSESQNSTLSRSKPASPPRFEQSFQMSECNWCQQAYRSAPNPLAIADQREKLAAKPKTPIAPIFQPALMPAMLMVPLIGGNEERPSSGTILGFIVLQDDRPRTWETEELELVKLVSTKLSNALLQTRMLHKVNSLVDDRTARLQLSMDLQSKLLDYARRQDDRLRHLNQQRYDFLAAVSHELNTPLASMKVAIEMLRQKSLSPDRQETYLNILEQEWRREKNLVENLLMLQRIGSQQKDMHVQGIDLNALLEEFKQAFELKWEDKGLQCCIQLSRSTLKLDSDEDSLRRIIGELLNNAGKYSNPDTMVICQVGEVVRRDIPHIVLTMTNIGPGIPPEDLPYIFDPFCRQEGATRQAVPGTGLGLALVKGLVQLLRGEIEVACRVLPGTGSSEISFTLALPQTLHSFS